MRILKSMLVLLVALAWVPLTSHCRLESLPGFEFLRCSTDMPTADESGDPCNEDGCCTVESAKYPSPRPQEISPLILVAMLSTENFGLLARSLPVEASLGVLTAAPPELRASWRFSLRTALPVRAPSLAS